MDLHELLIQISKEAILLGENEFTNEQIETKWLGTNGVKNEEIELVENQLNIKLPISYVILMKITNGFYAPNEIEPTFFPLNQIDYLKNIKPELIELSKIYNDFNYDDLCHAIYIGDFKDEQMFLLIPPYNEDENWKYWKYANWIPGEEEYNDLEEYFNEVLLFLIDCKNE